MINLPYKTASMIVPARIRRSPIAAFLVSFSLNTTQEKTKNQSQIVSTSSPPPLPAVLRRIFLKLDLKNTCLFHISRVHLRLFYTVMLQDMDKCVLFFHTGNF